jgi:hypothetical protein
VVAYSLENLTYDHDKLNKSLDEHDIVKITALDKFIGQTLGHDVGQVLNKKMACF